VSEHFFYAVYHKSTKKYWYGGGSWEKDPLNGLHFHSHQDAHNCLCRADLHPGLDSPNFELRKFQITTTVKRVKAR